MSQKLFAFYLGGMAKGAKLEVHDVAFAIGEKVEDCYKFLWEQWFGLEKNLHMDAYAPLTYVDGYEIHVLPKDASLPSNAATNQKLFFVKI